MQSPRVECFAACLRHFTLIVFFKQFKDEDFISQFDEETNIFTSLDIPYTRTVYNALQEIKYLDYTAEEMEGLQVLPDSFKHEVNEVHVPTASSTGAWSSPKCLPMVVDLM